MSVSRTRVEEPRHGPLAWLVVREGPLAGQRYDLDFESLLGRGRECLVDLEGDDYVSRMHARLRYEAGVWVLFDMGSAMGTYVNGQLVRRHQVKDGDVIRLGHTELVFKRVASAR